MKMFLALWRDVAAFHRKFDFPVEGEPTRRLLSQRRELITEEAVEVIAALKQVGRDDAGDEHLEKLTLELADLIYVAIGTAVALSLPIEEAWREVHRANMAKEANGGLKPSKPEGWIPPSVRMDR